MSSRRARGAWWPVVLGLALAACRPPPVSPPVPPPSGPLTLQKPSFGREIYYELAFTPGVSYRGVALSYALSDVDGEVVYRAVLEAGPIFDHGRRLEAGREVSYRLRRPEDVIKVVGPQRPLSPMGPPALDFARVRSARLLQIMLCRQEEVEWEPGDPLPLGVEETPRRATVFQRNICDRSRARRDPELERTFRFQQGKNPTRAWVDVVGRFHRDFPAGVSFMVDLLDGGSQPVKAGCALQVLQPEILRGQEMTYHLEFVGLKAVKTFEHVRSLRVRDVLAHGGGTRQVKSELVCSDSTP
jgi:hypothetical protein